MDSSIEFVPGIRVERITRSRLTESTTTDIKTLMSRRDAAIDLTIPPSSGELTEDAIKFLRNKQHPETALLALYVIDKESIPGPRTAKTRSPINAPEHIIGVGLVFPMPSGDDSEVEWEYISADLSGVELEETDLSELSDLEYEER
ncbi:hypothetical protein [Rhodococcus sp. OK302]|uniref:hypothetical protein n=1 Tax=Rhodococcus sp. OK302 TaxID=1882769 RepID=UPI001C3D1006|nr:hypothetical protein [Rhodococcus sp. OK302]